ncbi:MAG: hypothetical protein HY778_14850 [Betaproteobacteria bacterium]|nr:hypothetical protein [Betaproteobacteria bacterium]
MVTRRQFLMVGAGAAVLLTAAGMYQGIRERRVAAAGFAQGPLDERARQIVGALVPVMLAGALPAEPSRRVTVARVVDGVGEAVAGLGAAAQEELRQLFALLDLAPARVLLCGLWSPWPQAGEQDIARILERWRFSSLGLLRAAYAALHDLVLGAWYAREESWPAIGYPGPPEVA